MAGCLQSRNLIAEGMADQIYLILSDLKALKGNNIIEEEVKNQK